MDPSIKAASIITAAAVLALSSPLAYTLGYRAAHKVMVWASMLILAFFVSIYAVKAYRGYPANLFNNCIVIDAFTVTVSIAILVSLAITLYTLSFGSMKSGSRYVIESLAPMAGLSGILIAASNNILMMLASWILASTVSYAIVGLPRDKVSVESAFKYGIMGGVASAFLIVWFGAHVSASNTILLSKYTYPLGIAALALLLVALGFKTGVFPFHWWLPDVYGLSNGYSIAIIAGPVKAGVIAFIARALFNVAPGLGVKAAYLIAALSIATMTYGNIAAFTTRDLQRMMAYSSIAHVGYMLAPLAVIPLYHAPYELAVSAIALQLIAYSVSKSALYSFLGGCRVYGDTSLKSVARLTNTAARVSIAVLLLSLLGLPPLLGFWGKLYMFEAAVPIPWLLAACIVNSGLSSIYYVIAIREMHGESGLRVNLKIEYIALYTAAAVIIALGLGLAHPILSHSWVSTLKIH